MFAFFKRPTSAVRTAAGPRHRPAFEALEDRTVPAAVLPDVAVLSARLETSTQIRFQYQATGSPGAFQVGVYRSADAAFDAGDLQVGPLQTVTPHGTAVRTASVNLAGEMPIDPARKYVLVVADPGAALAESSEG